MNKDILLYFALLLWFVVPVSAQPTIFLPTETVETGTSVNVDVRVKNFVDIQTMQFSVNWNSDVLQFDSITNLDALPEYTATFANFNTNNTHLGDLTTLWAEPTFSSVTLEDSTVIFTISFSVIGAPDSFSVIAISDDPVVIEFSDINGNILPVTTVNGVITVESVVSTDPSLTIQSNEHFSLYQNEPNPFNNQSVIRFDLRESNEVEFDFYDINGKLIYSFKNQFQEGKNSVTIDANKLPGSGTYFYKMRTNKYSLTNKMVLVR